MESPLSQAAVITHAAEPSTLWPISMGCAETPVLRANAAIHRDWGAGLSGLFLPRWLPDGALDALRVRRLQHKLGNHANAGSEVELQGASACRVGGEGRGIAQILAMGAITRLHCALGTTGLTGQALSITLHRAAQPDLPAVVVRAQTDQD